TLIQSKNFLKRINLKINEALKP
ncbi:uncharacterized protein METZ01_LOCUS499174, partial [marine metagenome]